MSDYIDKNGEYRHGTSGERLNPNDTTLSGSSGRGGGGDGGVTSVAGQAGGIVALLAIIIIGPIVFAKIMGWLWGKFLDLGMFGRIVTTLLILCFGPFMMVLPLFAFVNATGPVQFGSVLTALVIIIMINVILLPAIWYFIWHYDAVRLMGASVFSNKIKKFAMFSWFGFLIAVIAGFATKSNAAGFIAIIAAIAGYIYYFVATKDYRQEAADNPSLNIPKAVKMIIMLIVVGLSVVIGIAGPPVANAMAEKNSEKRAAAFASTAGQTLEVNDTSLALRAEPSGTSSIIKTLKKDARVTAIGNMEGLWISVKSGNDTGYIFTPSVSLKTGNRYSGLVKFPFIATATASLNLRSNDIYARVQSTLEKGKEITVITKNRDFLVVEQDNVLYRLTTDRESLNFVRSITAE